MLKSQCFVPSSYIVTQLQAVKDGEGERHLKLKDYKLKEAEMRLEYLEKERQRVEEENIKKEREAAVSMKCLGFLFTLGFI